MPPTCSASSPPAGRATSAPQGRWKAALPAWKRSRMRKAPGDAGTAGRQVPGHRRRQARQAAAEAQIAPAQRRRAARQRNLPFPAGRDQPRRAAHGLRPPHRLSLALHLVRYRLCLQRRRIDGASTTSCSRVAAFDCAPSASPAANRWRRRPASPLLAALCDAGYSVSLETSGALDIGGVDPRVSRIVDLKAPGSGESAKNRWENLDLLTPHDELKFVLASREDYDWAVSACRQRRLFERCPVLFSPVQGQLDPAQLAQWMLDDRCRCASSCNCTRCCGATPPGR
jgi:hypothetical protein